VIAASGHSPSQIVLYNADHRWLIAADLAFPGAAPYLECGWTEDPFAEHLAALKRCAEATDLAAAAGATAAPTIAPGSGSWMPAC